MGAAEDPRPGRVAARPARSAVPAGALRSVTASMGGATASVLDLVDALRDGLVAGAVGGVVSGAPSTSWALVTGRDPLESVRAAGSILAPSAGRLGLMSAALITHSGLSLGWGVMLSWLLPRRRPVLLGALAGLAIAALDLGIVGRHIPRVQALPAVPQVADHLLYGATVAVILQREYRVRQQGSE